MSKHFFEIIACYTKKDILADVLFVWRYRPDLNWGMRVLQTLALPLGHGTV